VGFKIATLKTNSEENGFKIHKPLKGSSGGRPEKIYFLNEQQATLLLTYLRNSKIVREFKKALVKEFYRLKEENHKKLNYQLERENIELKRAMNRITADASAMTMDDFLDFVGQMSKAAKTMKELATVAEGYAKTGEAFLDRIAQRYKHYQRVQEQCKRLPKNQMKE
jgi:phage regulator Rha-like protein